MVRIVTRNTKIIFLTGRLCGKLIVASVMQPIPLMQIGDRFR